MSSYSQPVLGLDTYTPQTPAAHTVERPSGLLGMAFTPEAIEARAAEARLEKQMYSMGGLKEFALCDPDAFHQAFPNLSFMEPKKCQSF